MKNVKQMKFRAAGQSKSRSLGVGAIYVNDLPGILYISQQAGEVVLRSGYRAVRHSGGWIDIKKEQ